MVAIVRSECLGTCEVVVSVKLEQKERVTS